MSFPIYLTILIGAIGVIVAALFILFPKSKQLAIAVIIVSIAVCIAGATMVEKGTEGEGEEPTIPTTEPVTEEEFEIKTIDLFDLDTYSQNTDKIVIDTYYQKDNIGTVYGETMSYRYGWASGDDTVSSQVYYLDGMYEEFNGTLFLPFESRSVTEPYYPSTFLIYGDNELLYTAPEFLSGTNPVEFTVDVSGCEYLEIRMGGGWYKGDGGGLIPLVCLTNAELVKK